MGRKQASLKGGLIKQIKTNFVPLQLNGFLENFGCYILNEENFLNEVETITLILWFQSVYRFFCIAKSVYSFFTSNFIYFGFLHKN